MPASSKYRLAIVGLFILFVYVMIEDVSVRWGETVDLWNDIGSRREKMLDSTTIASRKGNLLAERDSLASLLIVDRTIFEQSRTGVFEFITRRATESKVRLESLLPLNAEREAQIENIGFQLVVSGGFHEIGEYLNMLETGSMPVIIRRCELALTTKGAQSLRADIVGVASIIEGDNRQ
jgi:hypothetical protein